MKRTTFKIIAGFLCAALLSNVALANMAEANLWHDRQKTLGKSRGTNKSASSQLAYLTPQILNQLPQTLPQTTALALTNRLRNQASSPSAKDLLSLLPALSSSFGTVQKISFPPSRYQGKTVIHIQDVHMNPEAQQNIGKTMKKLLEEKKIDLVALEGAFQPLDLKKYVQFPFPNVLRKAADFLLRENRISGAVHAALIHASPVPLVGIDDAAQYQANIQAYKDSRVNEERLKKEVGRTQLILNREKSVVFNPALQEFDQRITAYRNGTDRMGPFVQFLLRNTKIVSPHTEVFLESWRIESRLDFFRVESERTRLVSDLVPKLSKDQTTDLLNWTVAYRMGQIRHADFYNALKQLCQSRGVALDRYAAMNSYIQYLLLSDSIDAEKLFTDMARMEQEGYDALAKTPQEITLIQESKRLYFIGKLLDFSLTSEEWKDYRAMRNKKDVIASAASRSNNKLMSGRTGIVSTKQSIVENKIGHKMLGKDRLPQSPFGLLRNDINPYLNLSSFERFYEEAQARDQALANNLLRAMDQNKSSVAVLVTGGFHSSGIQTRLKEAGITTITFVPKISKVDSDQGAAYLSVFTQEKTPLDKLFEGQKLFVAPNPAQLGALPFAATALMEAQDPSAPLTPDRMAALRAMGLPRSATSRDISNTRTEIGLPGGNIETTLTEELDPDVPDIVSMHGVPQRFDRRRLFADIKNMAAALAGAVELLWSKIPRPAILTVILTATVWLPGCGSIPSFSSLWADEAAPAPSWYQPVEAFLNTDSELRDREVQFRLSLLARPPTHTISLYDFNFTIHEAPGYELTDAELDTLIDTLPKLQLPLASARQFRSLVVVPTTDTGNHSTGTAFDETGVISLYTDEKTPQANKVRQFQPIHGPEDQIEKTSGEKVFGSYSLATLIAHEMAHLDDNDDPVFSEYWNELYQRALSELEPPFNDGYAGVNEGEFYARTAEYWARDSFGFLSKQLERQSPTSVEAILSYINRRCYDPDSSTIHAYGSLINGRLQPEDWRVTFSDGWISLQTHAGWIRFQINEDSEIAAVQNAVRINQLTDRAYVSIKPAIALSSPIRSPFITKATTSSPINTGGEPVVTLVPTLDHVDVFESSRFYPTYSWSEAVGAHPELSEINIPELVGDTHLPHEVGRSYYVAIKDDRVAVSLNVALLADDHLSHKTTVFYFNNDVHATPSILSFNGDITKVIFGRNELVVGFVDDWQSLVIDFEGNVIGTVDMFGSDPIDEESSAEAHARAITNAPQFVHHFTNRPGFFKAAFLNLSWPKSFLAVFGSTLFQILLILTAPLLGWTKRRERATSAGLPRRSFLHWAAAALIGIATLGWSKEARAGGINVDPSGITKEDLERFKRVWGVLLFHLDPKDKELLLTSAQIQANIMKIEPAEFMRRIGHSMPLLKSHGLALEVFKNEQLHRAVAIHPDAFTNDAHLLKDLMVEVQILLSMLRPDRYGEHVLSSQNERETRGAERALPFLRKIAESLVVQDQLPDLVRDLKSTYIPELEADLATLKESAPIEMIPVLTPAPAKPPFWKEVSTWVLVVVIIISLIRRWKEQRSPPPTEPPAQRDDSTSLNTLIGSIGNSPDTNPTERPLLPAPQLGQQDPHRSEKGDGGSWFTYKQWPFYFKYLAWVETPFVFVFSFVVSLLLNHTAYSSLSPPAWFLAPVLSWLGHGLPILLGKESWKENRFFKKSVLELTLAKVFIAALGFGADYFGVPQLLSLLSLLALLSVVTYRHHVIQKDFLLSASQTVARVRADAARHTALAKQLWPGKAHDEATRLLAAQIMEETRARSRAEQGITDPHIDPFLVEEIRNALMGKRMDNELFEKIPEWCRKLQKQMERIDGNIGITAFEDLANNAILHHNPDNDTVWGSEIKLWSHREGWINTSNYGKQLAFLQKQKAASRSDITFFSAHILLAKEGQNISIDPRAIARIIGFLEGEDVEESPAFPLFLELVAWDDSLADLSRHQNLFEMAQTGSSQKFRLIQDYVEKIAEVRRTLEELEPGFELDLRGYPNYWQDHDMRFIRAVLNMRSSYIPIGASNIYHKLTADDLVKMQSSLLHPVSEANMTFVRPDWIFHLVTEINEAGGQVSYEWLDAFFKEHVRTTDFNSVWWANRLDRWAKKRDRIDPDGIENAITAVEQLPAEEKFTGIVLTVIYFLVKQPVKIAHDIGTLTFVVSVLERKLARESQSLLRSILLMDGSFEGIHFYAPVFEQVRRGSSKYLYQLQGWFGELRAAQKTVQALPVGTEIDLQSNEPWRGHNADTLRSVLNRDPEFLVIQQDIYRKQRPSGGAILSYDWYIRWAAFETPLFFVLAAAFVAYLGHTPLTSFAFLGWSFAPLAFRYAHWFFNPVAFSSKDVRELTHWKFGIAGLGILLSMMGMPPSGILLLLAIPIVSLMTWHDSLNQTAQTQREAGFRGVDRRYFLQSLAAAGLFQFLASCVRISLPSASSNEENGGSLAPLTPEQRTALDEEIERIKASVVPRDILIDERTIRIYEAEGYELTDEEFEIAKDTLQKTDSQTIKKLNIIVIVPSHFFPNRAGEAQPDEIHLFAKKNGIKEAKTWLKGPSNQKGQRNALKFVGGVSTLALVMVHELEHVASRSLRIYKMARKSYGIEEEASTVEYPFSWTDLYERNSARNDAEPFGSYANETVIEFDAEVAANWSEDSSSLLTSCLSLASRGDMVPLEALLTFLAHKRFSPDTESLQAYDRLMDKRLNPTRWDVSLGDSSLVIKTPNSTIDLHMDQDRHIDGYALDENEFIWFAEPLPVTAFVETMVNNLDPPLPFRDQPVYRHFGPFANFDEVLRRYPELINTRVKEEIDGAPQPDETDRMYNVVIKDNSYLVSETIFFQSLPAQSKVFYAHGFPDLPSVLTFSGEVHTLGYYPDFVHVGGFNEGNYKLWRIETVLKTVASPPVGGSWFTYEQWPFYFKYLSVPETPFVFLLSAAVVFLVSGTSHAAFAPLYWFLAPTLFWVGHGIPILLRMESWKENRFFNKSVIELTLLKGMTAAVTVLLSLLPLLFGLERTDTPLSIKLGSLFFLLPIVIARHWNIKKNVLVALRAQNPSAEPAQPKITSELEDIRLLLSKISGESGQTVQTLPPWFQDLVSELERRGQQVTFHEFERMVKSHTMLLTERNDMAPGYELIQWAQEELYVTANRLREHIAAIQQMDETLYLARCALSFFILAGQEGRQLGEDVLDVTTLAAFMHIEGFEADPASLLLIKLMAVDASLSAENIRSHAPTLEQAVSGGSKKLDQLIVYANAVATAKRLIDGVEPGHGINLSQLPNIRDPEMDFIRVVLDLDDRFLPVGPDKYLREPNGGENQRTRLRLPNRPLLIILFSLLWFGLSNQAIAQNAPPYTETKKPKEGALLPDKNKSDGTQAASENNHDLDLLAQQIAHAAVQPEENIANLIPIAKVGVEGIDGRRAGGFAALNSEQQAYVMEQVQRQLGIPRRSPMTFSRARHRMLTLHGYQFEPIKEKIDGANVGLDLNITKVGDIQAAVKIIKGVASQMSPGTRLVLPDASEVSVQRALKQAIGKRVLKKIVFLERGKLERGKKDYFIINREQGTSAFDVSVFLEAAEAAGLSNMVVATHGEYILDPAVQALYKQRSVLVNVMLIVETLNGILGLVVDNHMPLDDLDKLARAIATAA